MLLRKFNLQLFIFILFTGIFLSGCISPKDKVERAKLLKTETTEIPRLLAEVNRFAKVNSMRAKMDLKLEDNSFAETGIAEKYKTADGEIVVQRPANIMLKVQVPVIKYDVAQMTSDGEKFRVAVLNDGGDGKYKRFIIGTNNADYSRLQENLSQMDLSNGGNLKQNVNALANLRPQHFTDAMLVRPIDTEKFVYTQSSIFQEESDETVKKKSPVRRVLRGYYFLDEYSKNDNGSLKIQRRFWFDRVGGIRLARQQIFDTKGEIESDIVYGREGVLGGNAEYGTLPLQVEVTRPKEKYKMVLSYQAAESVTLGKTYPQTAFVLLNTWNLPEVDLDQKAITGN